MSDLGKWVMDNTKRKSKLDDIGGKIIVFYNIWLYNTGFGFPQLRNRMWLQVSKNKHIVIL